MEFGKLSNQVRLRTPRRFTRSEAFYYLHFLHDKVSLLFHFLLVEWSFFAPVIIICNFYVMQEGRSLKDARIAQSDQC